MKRHVSGADRQKLIAEIARLDTLDNTGLKARWKAVYETATPARMKPDLLRYALAYRLQERALGGPKPCTRRPLERVADDAQARRPVKVVPVHKLGTGTMLICKWGGVGHQVTVLEKGVLFVGIGIARSPRSPA